MIRVVIADDQPLVLAGLRALIDHAEDITVVGEATNGRRRWRWSAGNGRRWC